MNYEFDDGQKEKLHRLTDFMLGYNRKVNLTRITEKREVWEKHFVDSALPLQLFNVPRGTKIIDVGTGAGFPGIVWKLCRPDLDVTLLDSLKKRTDYLTEASRIIDVVVSVANIRAELGAHTEVYREQFGVAVSRAVANLPALLEYMLPFVSVGGYALAMKGAKDEVECAAKTADLLGGSICDVRRYELPSGDKRTLVVVKKISQTPTKYPRKQTNISKNPL